MSPARKEYFLLIGGLILLACTAVVVYYIERVPDHSGDISEISTLITTFGDKQKTLSLQQADTEALKLNIEAAYKQFVNDALLQRWQSNPQQAPGRLTSSPWPERIEIDAITPQGSGYIVSGRVITMTSGGQAGEKGAILLVMKDGDTWKIIEYQEAAAQASTSTAS